MPRGSPWGEVSHHRVPCPVGLRMSQLSSPAKICFSGKSVLSFLSALERERKERNSKCVRQVSIEGHVGQVGRCPKPTQGSDRGSLSERFSISHGSPPRNSSASAAPSWHPPQALRHEVILALGTHPAFSWWRTVFVLALRSSTNNLQMVYVAAVRKVCDSHWLPRFMACESVCACRPPHAPHRKICTLKCTPRIDLKWDWSAEKEGSNSEKRRTRKAG